MRWRGWHRDASLLSDRRLAGWRTPLRPPSSAARTRRGRRAERLSNKLLGESRHSTDSISLASRLLRMMAKATMLKKITLIA